MGEKKVNVNSDPNDMNIVERVKAPTPKFFKTLRTIGLTLAAVGGVILAAPISISAGLIAVAGYVTLAGGVLTAVSQTAVDSGQKEDFSHENP